MEMLNADERVVNKAVQYLKKGKSVVYSTDTAYGLGVDATNLSAVKKLYKIKERGFKQPVHVIVSDLKMAKEYVQFDKLSEKIFKEFMPGPLTMVLQLRNTNSKSWNVLSAGTGTMGVRMPDNKIALSLVKKLGRPITTTSANPSAHRSGGTSPYSTQDSWSQFQNKKYRPDLFLDAGILPKRKTSTIVRIEDDKPVILRQGPITEKQIVRGLK